MIFAVLIGLVGVLVVLVLAYNDGRRDAKIYTWSTPIRVGGIYIPLDTAYSMGWYSIKEREEE